MFVVIYLSQGVNITGAALTQIGYETDSDVMVTWVERTNGTWPGDGLNTWDTLSFKTVGSIIIILYSKALTHVRSN